ncbi:MAG: hypothetical protein GY839_18370 [candidate division Zixibacteria bacterium]|nr:hypothetical protein [candidate division Zixibacteria bacterium]
MLINALKQSGSNQSKASRKLGISREVMRYRCGKYGLI